MPQNQWAYLAPRFFFLNTILQYKEPWLLGKMVDYRARAGKYNMSLKFLIVSENKDVLREW